MQTLICHTLKFPNYHLISIGARLFEPRSIPVQNLVFTKSIEVWGGENKAWIGINDKSVEGEFVFASSGENINVTDWKPYEPNDLNNQDCVTYSAYSNYNGNHYWDDDRCSNIYSFICELLP